MIICDETSSLNLLKILNISNHTRASKDTVNVYFTYEVNILFARRRLSYFFISKVINLNLMQVTVLQRVRNRCTKCIPEYKIEDTGEKGNWGLQVILL